MKHYKHKEYINGNEYLKLCKTFREYSISKQIDTETIDEIKKVIASNNKRRLAYGLPSRRGNMNADRVAKRRKEKLYRKRHIKPVYYVDEGTFLFNMRRRRCYPSTDEYMIESPKPRRVDPDFSPMPYDFDAQKNALSLSVNFPYEKFDAAHRKIELARILRSGQKPVLLVLLDPEREYANLAKELLYEKKE